MKYLYVLGPIYSPVNFTFEIDSIISKAKTDDVTVLICNGFAKKCSGNTFGNRLLCQECKKRTAALLSSIPNLKVIKQEDIILSCNNNHKRYQYNSLRELNKIIYSGFEIGYGVSSYYISLTRNLNPYISKRLRHILDNWLDISMTHADIANAIIADDYDRVYVINGRLFDSKPYQEVAFLKGIHVILGESYVSIDGEIVKMNFDNVRVHSVVGNCNNIQSFWESSKVPINKRRSIAASFYEKRANAIKTDDKIYTSGQKKGMLPADWDIKKNNIVIFNSSEDEFAAIGGEFEKDNLFSSQMEGIKFILDNVKDPLIHFYLRIHPNLMRIRYKYHTDLYKLETQYNNITVIPGDSPVSSYTLLKSCQRVITFGSTMGVEAAYAGKIAMVMRPCFYYHLGVNYVPNNKTDVLDFINGKIDFSPNIENALKYSYYYYNNERCANDNSECKIIPHTIKLGRKRYTFWGMNMACSDIRMFFISLLNAWGTLNEKLLIPKKEK